MKTADFEYHLPPELIAQTGIEPRDHARLLVACRADRTISHRRFHELPALLDPGDLLIVNDSRVLPARLLGRRAGEGQSAQVELLMLRRVAGNTWQCLAKPGRRMRPGQRLVFPAPEGDPVNAEVTGESEGGTRIVRFDDDQRALAGGHQPLPHYIRGPLDDPERYQTVYAREPGSAAAPTAGLHFTERLMERLAACGIRTAAVTLHVGLGTFRPVESESIEDHVMHSEEFFLPAATAEAIAETRRQGRRVVAVGTTAIRVLETAAQCPEADASRIAHHAFRHGETRLFITPGYRFRAVDALITNFHLPRSTLLMLVSAFAGTDFVRRVYAEAIAERYRFYSLGDACLFL